MSDTTTEPAALAVTQQQLATAPVNPFAVATLKEAIEMAEYLAKAKFFGLDTGPKVLTIMKVAADDGTTFSQATRRFHAQSDGKLTQKASYTQAEFLKNNWIIWHMRTAEVCIASFGRGKITPEARERASARWKLAYQLERSEDGSERSELAEKVADLTFEGEITIVRTMEDAIETGVAMNWQESDDAGNGEFVLKPAWKSAPRQMLHSRCLTEGVGVIDSSVTAGGATEDELDQGGSMKMVMPSKKSVIERKIEELTEQAKKTEDTQARNAIYGQISDLKLDLEEASPAKKIEPSKPIPVVEVELMPRGKDETPAWKNYKIRTLKSKAFKDKKLGELTADELDTLYEKRSKPYLLVPASAVDPLVLDEAKMIKLAWEAGQP